MGGAVMTRKVLTLGREKEEESTAMGLAMQMGMRGPRCKQRYRQRRPR